jgi:hypothetical protein
MKSEPRLNYSFFRKRAGGGGGSCPESQPAGRTRFMRDSQHTTENKRNYKKNQMRCNVPASITIMYTLRAIFLVESHKMVHYNLPESVSGPLIKLERGCVGVGLHTTCKPSRALPYSTRPCSTPKAVESEVLIAVTMRSTIFRDVVPCSLAGVHRRFGGPYYLHIRGICFSPHKMEYGTPKRWWTSSGLRGVTSEKVAFSLR